MTLICALCRWRPADGTPMGVVAAHFETEHDSTDGRLELVVLCLRCDKPMTYERSEGLQDFFSCLACHRTRVIGRTA
jgi:hypothetical protein